MRVLMLGWEFPPYVRGGLGTACHGLAGALAAKGTKVLFILPSMNGAVPRISNSHLTVRAASGVRLKNNAVYTMLSRKTRETWRENLAVRSVDSILFPYATAASYAEHLAQLYSVEHSQTVTSIMAPPHTVQEPGTITMHGGYGRDLMSEVFRFSLATAAIALEEEFDVIHVHDWMTYPAGILIKKLTGKPLVSHIHATEYDRSGDNVNSEVAHIEWAGLDAADRAIAVSHYTKALVERVYRIPGDKITVVHNAVSRKEARKRYAIPECCRNEKRVLFMGRVTFQKGPDYFVEAARLVLNRIPNARFIMAGSGDMLSRMVRRVAQLRMGSRFHFTGFLSGDEVDRIYALSDLYVMPSVSEPFGIAPLEAMAYDVPVIISRQSGVSEVVRNALKVDFWDTRELANKICAMLAYPRLAAEVVRNCREELKAVRWENAADQLNALYAELVREE